MKEFNLNGVLTPEDKKQWRDAVLDRAKQQPCTDLLAKSKNNLYCCELCGSGTHGGRESDGAVKYYKDSNKWYCNACKNAALNGKPGDYMDLVKLKYSLQDYNETLDKAAELLGLTREDYAVQIKSRDDRITAGWQEHKAIKAKEEPANYEEYYKICATRIEDPEAISYLQARGISLATAQELNIGYDPAADPASAPGATGDEYKPHPVPRIIIPCSASHYVARSIDPETPKRYKKMNPAREKGAGEVSLFNSDVIKDPTEIIFVTDGAFDALSFEEIGEAGLALNSKGNGEKLTTILQKQPTEYYPQFVIVPDNEENPDTDASTKATAEELKSKLRLMGYQTIVYNVAGEYHDANDALIADRAAFIARAEAARKELKNAGAIERAFKLWAAGEQFTTEQNDWIIEKTDFLDYENIREFFTGHGLLDADSVPTEYGQKVITEKDDEPPAEPPAEPQENSVAKFLAQIQTEKYKPLKTELAFFDQLLGGGPIRQTLLILLAAPGSGKTTLCAQIAEQIASHGHDVLYLNFEMSNDQMLAKAISRRLKRKGFPRTAKQILQGYRWTDEEREKITEAVIEYQQEIAPYIQYNPDGASNEVEKLRNYLYSKGAEAKAAGKEAPIVVIDYLHLLTSKGDTDIKEQIKKACVMLKDYAIDYDTFVIAIGATSRSESGKITLQSGRDSSNIEFSGDYIIGLNYAALENGEADKGDLSRLQQEKPRKMVLKSLKGRLDDTGNQIKVFYDAANNIFYGQENSVFFGDPAPTDTPRRGSKFGALGTQTGGTRDQKRQRLRQAYINAKIEADAADEAVTLYMLAEQTQTTQATVKSWIKEFGGYILQDNPYKPEPGEVNQGDVVIMAEPIEEEDDYTPKKAGVRYSR